MNWKAHVLIAGLLNSFLVFFMVWRGYLLPTPLMLILIVFVSVIYSILPDIDMKNSTIRVFSTVVGLLFIIASIVLNTYYMEHWVFMAIPLFSASILLLLFFAKHGGHFHSLIAGLITSLLVYPIEPVLFFFALFAYQSHLIADNHKKKMW